MTFPLHFATRRIAFPAIFTCLAAIASFSFPALRAQSPGSPSADPSPVLRALPLNEHPAANALPASPPAPVAPVPLEVRPPVPPPAAVAISPAGDLNSPIEWAPDGKPLGDDAVRLQVFLDQENFGPGIIDGKPGQFTKLAVRAWNEANGHPLEDWEPAVRQARKSVPNAFAIAVVPELVNEWVDENLPTSKAAQAKKKRMSYRSVAEFMSERYHCDVPYLTALNAGKSMSRLQVRDTVIVPNVIPFQIEDLTGKKWEEDELMSKRHAVVDTKTNQVRIFEATTKAIAVDDDGNPVGEANRSLIASFPITPGQPKFVPFGTWTLRNSTELPWWRYDQQFLDSGKRSETALNIPPGPNSPVGVIWNGLSKSGIGLHGTSNPETIGRARSAGCVRLANWDAVRIPTLLRPGATVEIR